MNFNLIFEIYKFIWNLFSQFATKVEVIHNFNEKFKWIENIPFIMMGIANKIK